VKESENGKMRGQSAGGNKMHEKRLTDLSPSWVWWVGGGIFATESCKESRGQLNDKMRSNPAGGAE